MTNLEEILKEFELRAKFMDHDNKLFQTFDRVFLINALKIAVEQRNEFMDRLADSCKNDEIPIAIDVSKLLYDDELINILEGKIDKA